MEVPWDAEHVVSTATRRQRQMAWVPAVGMSVIPQREREGEERKRERESEGERRGRAQHSREKRERRFQLFSLICGLQEKKLQRRFRGDMQGAR
ncbi:neurogenic differentiation factor 6-B-like [Xyrichtys novacula]|uniref:Neurogenic differentiation factor 6-B-like n=1 Tax=Xyrichtys novacula TaxID=13765 RepID=A0AAV1GJA5_XYRNO|nr:neurogenic differentiation factor 6-B-like [Xyrichtys novacula]